MLKPVMLPKNRNFASSGLGIALVFFAVASIAQVPKVEVKTPSEISALETSLRQQAAAGEGLATAFVEQYPQYYTQMIVRTRSGEVEIHQNYDEIVIVRDGNATVYTGGTPQNLRTAKPGEQRGSAMSGGRPSELTPGSLVYIPAGIPHQVMVPAGGSIAYLDMKVAHQ